MELCGGGRPKSAKLNLLVDLASHVDLADVRCDNNNNLLCDTPAWQFIRIALCEHLANCALGKFNGFYSYCIK